MPPGARVDRGRHAYPEIRIANPEFRIGACRRCICARETDAKDTFGSARGRRAIADVTGRALRRGPCGKPERLGVQAASERAARDVAAVGGVARGA